ncbi:MAG: mechanosensitive ion channel family protein [Candidatus Eisenbacteria bacterium]|uniref:Mechanosensitive ion channel family protein n=1 Tax=Eiseniibacteriota bacterium TaxID=2212470 RepID=A0A948WF41_UNCEI|nr:mechanosensitive ion channel family protein [Candidatus Eisenbacteria bacterium]MBU1947198.1 mechanosensitive ion channel family protein [Candidatus Eisenbacteria bacterium]MBU2693353.1 mechanosensitive ion channel family protein [Candidatus Eisenbacteria bacterium]
MSGLWAGLVEWVQAHSGLSHGLFERLAGSLGLVILFLGVRILVSAILDRRVPDISKKYILIKSTSYVLGFALFMAMLIVWFGNATGWVSYLGLLSAGLAIALQDPVTNFAGWIFLTIRKPFVVGDRIQIGEHRGDVIDLRLFQFSIVEIGNWVDADQSTGRIIHIPNGWVFKYSAANYTQGFKFIWNELPVTVTFESNWERAKEILSEVAERHSLLRSHEAQEQVQRAARKYLIKFTHLTPIVWTSVIDNGITLTVRYICDPRKRRSSAAAIWEDVLKAFAANDDIDFAYPTTRFYHNMSEGKPGARAGVAGPPVEAGR